MGPIMQRMPEAQCFSRQLIGRKFLAWVVIVRTPRGRKYVAHMPPLPLLRGPHGSLTAGSHGGPGGRTVPAWCARQPWP